MEATRGYGGQMVFGLDIGTRSIVGTVGYKDEDRFVVVAQKVKEHETRAMQDGQIHDIEKVGNSIRIVKEALENELGRRLTEVCIAAAGRVLETATSHAEYGFEEEHRVTKEDIFTLNSMAVEQAYASFLKNNDSKQKFYCVGNSVINYYLNDFQISNLENHKARKIGVDLIATFLPDEVVDGLNQAVELAGLQVANMTLEPIAAIQVAIPERFRLLNIALVDVGAGTSDISITKDGSIIAYGMIPMAGDGLTEQIALSCLTDFNVAEQIKRDSTKMDVVEFEDIMGITQTMETKEIDKILEPTLEAMTDKVAESIKELNGGKSVSAVFVVGGGGKVNGYTKMLSEKLGIQAERVAIRGKEVMQKIEFLDPTIEKDSLLVTPIGICLNFYESNNNFIYVSFNGEKVKLYDNKHLTVTDAAIQVKFPNDKFFPRRGKELNFTVDGVKKIVRGEVGEGAQISINGKPANIHTRIGKNDIIQVEESTAGEAAHEEIGHLPEFKGSLTIDFDGKKVSLPKFASVNDRLESRYYSIQDGDRIEFLNYYTVEQILTFMDIPRDGQQAYQVNNQDAAMDTKVYENFTVTTVREITYRDLPEENYTEENFRGEAGGHAGSPVNPQRTGGYAGSPMNPQMAGGYAGSPMNPQMAGGYAGAPMSPQMAGGYTGTPMSPQGVYPAGGYPQAAAQTPSMGRQMIITVNGRPIVMQGKDSYIFVDVFDYIDFDLSKPQGAIVANLNGRAAQYMEELHDGDGLEIYWKTV